MPSSNVNSSQSSNIPASSSQPSSEDPAVGSVSSEGGELAKIVSLFHMDAIMQCATPQNNANLPIVHSYSDSVFDVNSSTTTLRPGDMRNVICLLDASNANSTKCNYVDILFLILLVQEELFADQRNSRFNAMTDIRKSARSAANTVYQMKMNEAKETYKAEKKAAMVKIIVGIIGICTGVVSMVTSVVNGMKALGIALKGSISGIMNKIQKALEKMQGTLQKVLMATTAARMILSIGSGVAQLPLNLDVAKHRYMASLAAANAKLLETFFNFSLTQVQDMQEAYAESKKITKATIDDISELLQKLQESRLSITRNI
ncbi:MAG: hypothetical protein LBI81_02400 [Puniceicoccales bacterium]|jgi:hypothetical protein|nr:hypothetical protein [Puniceicoccales bacterium]